MTALNECMGTKRLGGIQGRYAPRDDVRAMRRLETCEGTLNFRVACKRQIDSEVKLTLDSWQVRPSPVVRTALKLRVKHTPSLYLQCSSI